MLVTWCCYPWTETEISCFYETNLISLFPLIRNFFCVCRASDPLRTHDVWTSAEMGASETRSQVLPPAWRFTNWEQWSRCVLSRSPLSGGFLLYVVSTRRRVEAVNVFLSPFLTLVLLCLLRFKGCVGWKTKVWLMLEGACQRNKSFPHFLTHPALTWLFLHLCSDAVCSHVKSQV